MVLAKYQPNSKHNSKYLTEAVISRLSNITLSPRKTLDVSNLPFKVHRNLPFCVQSIDPEMGSTKHELRVTL